jgi:hypothetical protein
VPREKLAAGEKREQQLAKSEARTTFLRGAKLKISLITQWGVRQLFFSRIAPSFTAEINIPAGFSLFCSFADDDRTSC